MVVNGDIASSILVVVVIFVVVVEVVSNTKVYSYRCGSVYMLFGFLFVRYKGNKFIFCERTRVLSGFFVFFLFCFLKMCSSAKE